MFAKTPSLKIVFKHNTFLLELGLTHTMGMNPPIKTLVPRKRWDVRDIPKDHRVCVHVEVEVDPNDDQLITKVNRCTFPSMRKGPTGYLCSLHTEINNPIKKVMPPLDWDKLVSEDIIVTDAMAIFEAKHDNKIVLMRPPHSTIYLRTIEGN